MGSECWLLRINRCFPDSTCGGRWPYTFSIDREGHMELIEYEVEDHIAVITLNRPEKANAQNRDLLVEPNPGWTTAAADDDVRVIVLQANGKHFSAGHDLGGQRPQNSDG